MSYEFVCDKIEVRTSLNSNKEREYIIRGYASIPNAVDLYRYQINKDGSTTSFKSLFTENAVRSMAEQAKMKKVFVDTEHQTAALINIRSILNSMQGELSQRGVDITPATTQIIDLVRQTDIPFAKVVDLKIDDKGLFIDTRLNPFYRDLDPKYFDAVWNSIQHGFINGISINFTPKNVVEEFRNGEYVSVIDDVDLYGFSYVGNPALPENSIVQVAMRSMMEFRSTQKGENMTEIKQETNNEVEQLKKELESLKTKLVQEEQTKQEEKQKAIEAEKSAYKTQVEELQKTVETMKKDAVKREETSVKGVVAPDTAYRDSSTVKQSPAEFKDNLSKLNFGELVALQAEFNTLRAEDPAKIARLQRTSQDIIARI